MNKKNILLTLTLSQLFMLSQVFAKTQTKEEFLEKLDQRIIEQRENKAKKINEFHDKQVEEQKKFYDKNPNQVESNTFKRNQEQEAKKFSEGVALDDQKFQQTYLKDIENYNANVKAEKAKDKSSSNDINNKLINTKNLKLPGTGYKDQEAPKVVSDTEKELNFGKTKNTKKKKEVNLEIESGDKK